MAAQEKAMPSTKIDRLKELVDPTQLLLSLGFNISYDNQDEVRAPCIIHGGDNKTAFCFKKSSKRFYCFTKGCESDGGEVNNDIISLVMKVNKCSFSSAVKFLSGITGFSIDEEEMEEVEVAGIKRERERNKFIRGTKSVSEVLPEVPEEVVKEYRASGARYFESLGISKDLIDKFELGTTVDFEGVERGTIPIRDECGKLVSISGRRTDGNGEPRYRLVREFKKRKVLYNLNNVVCSSSSGGVVCKDTFGGKILVVEGFKALWHVYRCGFDNVVAVMGKVMRPEQRNLLVKCGFGYAYLLLDGDDAGRDGMEKSLLLLQGKINVCPIYLPQGKSPDDLDVSELKDLIKLFI